MSSNKAFGISVAFNVKPDNQAEFLKAMQNNVKQTLETESNSLQFQLGQDLDDPDKFYIHEEYQNIKDHRETHTKTEHYATCIKLIETTPVFKAPPVVDEFYLMHDGPDSKILNRECVCLNVELNIKPERREEFIKCIENNKAGSDREPLCLQYSWGESIEHPNTFHFHEQYVGEEGVEAHNAAPHFKVWEEFAGTGPFSKPPTVQKFKAIVVE